MIETVGTVEKSQRERETHSVRMYQFIITQWCWLEDSYHHDDCIDEAKQSIQMEIIHNQRHGVSCLCRRQQLIKKQVTGATHIVVIF
jgi:hypothetical protein